jgi:hypothetical protein
MKLLKEIYRKESGQAFIMVLILLLVGMLIIAPLLAFMSTGLISAQAINDKTDEVYAADAGIEDAIYRILNNDPLLPQVVGIPWPYGIDTLNNKSVDVEIIREDDVESFLEELLGGDAGVHSEWTVIEAITAPGEMTITVIWDPPPPGHLTKNIIGVGAWLEGDYSYVADSAVGMPDDYPIFDFRTQLYKGGTAFIWEWAGNDKPGFVAGDIKTLTFNFDPTDNPNFYFSWFVGQSNDVGVVVGAQTFGIWKITSISTDTDTGDQTKVVAYLSSNGAVTPYRVKVLTWEIDPPA